MFCSNFNFANTSIYFSFRPKFPFWLGKCITINKYCDVIDMISDKLLCNN